jgi:hypothetical protein
MSDRQDDDLEDEIIIEQEDDESETKLPLKSQRILARANLRATARVCKSASLV